MASDERAAFSPESLSPEAATENRPHAVIVGIAVFAITAGCILAVAAFARSMPS